MCADRYYAVVADGKIVATDLPRLAKPNIFGTRLDIEGVTCNVRNKLGPRSTSLIV